MHRITRCWCPWQMPAGRSLHAYKVASSSGLLATPDVGHPCPLNPQPEGGLCSPRYIRDTAGGMPHTWRTLAAPTPRPYNVQLLTHVKFSRWRNRFQDWKAWRSIHMQLCMRGPSGAA